MKKLTRSLMILCGAAAFALLPACQTTTTAKCEKCGSATCAGKCDTAAKACPKCGKMGCTTCKM